MPPSPSPDLAHPPAGDQRRYPNGNKNGNRILASSSSSSLQDLSTYAIIDSDEKASLFKERKRWSRKVAFSAAISVLLFLSVAVGCFFWFGKRNLRPDRYYVVLDCGSTGTRVFIYEATLRVGRLPELRRLPEGMKARSGRAYNRMETEPGFSKLVRNESGLQSAMLPLIEFAERRIPRSAHAKTSVFLCATAGMRRLPKSDSEWVLEKAWGILKKSRFVSRRKWVRVISGMEEGYYGWVALNYRMGNLGSFGGRGRDTVGALDLGGSSLQVTFENNKEVVQEEGSSLDFRIGEFKHRLSAYSLSGYGLNDAFDKSVAYLCLKQQLPDKNLSSGNLVLKHPCLQSGYKEKYVCSLCATIGQEGTSVKDRVGLPVELLGAPEWEECNSLAKAIVNLSEWSNSSSIDCDIRPCALGDDLPRPRGHFYAMSGFFVVYRFFNLSSEDALDDMLRKGQLFCEQTWEAAKASVVPQPFVEQYCFRAPYVASLLRHGLHIMNDEVVIGSGSISWTLGVALLESAQAFSSRMPIPSHGMLSLDAGSLRLLILIMVSLVALFCLIRVISNWFQKFLQRTYLPIKHDDATGGCTCNIFNFQRCKHACLGDGKVKTPLSPVASTGYHSEDLSHGFGAGNTQLMGYSSCHTAFSLHHSHSSESLVLENSTGTYWKRGSRQLLSRKSPSREDLSSLLTLHTMK